MKILIVIILKLQERVNLCVIKLKDIILMRWDMNFSLKHSRIN